jgi:mannose-6-phosphate isomerase-like protein (cupin superfamily)
MLKAGDEIHIPHEGEHWTIVRSAIAEGNGEFIADLEMDANRSGPPFHVHPHENERIEVFAGSVTFFMPDGPVVLRAGDTFTIPAGTRHTFKIGPEGLRARGSYNGPRFEELVTQLAPGDKKGFVRMAQHCRATNWAGSRITSPAVRGLLAVVALGGRMFGIRRRLV